MKKDDLYRYTGTPEQLFGHKEYRLQGGKADDLRVIEIYNSKGLSLDVLPDRGMDIANLKFMGMNLSFLSNTGLVSSKYFEEDKNRGFMRNFYAGFLTTCGLSYMGASCEEDGYNLGLHGRISNTPAEEVSAQNVIKDDEGLIFLRGKVKESEVFGSHLVLEREIKLDAFKNVFTIKDTIENLGFESVPLMLLYHMNIGYPFLDEDIEIILDSKEVIARDEVSEKNLDKYLKAEKPEDGRIEEVFFHKINEIENLGRFKILNRKLGIVLSVTYPISKLPYFTQWKSMRSGEYVMGFEPGNCNVNGRKNAREENILEFLPARSKKTIEIVVEINKLNV